MLLSIAAGVIALVFILKRLITLKNPLYKFKTIITNDRFIETLMIFVFFVGGLFTIVGEYMSDGIINFKKLIILIVVAIVLLTLAFYEYKRNQVGIYEKGILIKSLFYSWNRIYTYRVKKLVDGRNKVIFYIHNRNDEEKLDIIYYVVNDKNKDNILKAIGDKLDPSRE